MEINEQHRSKERRQSDDTCTILIDTFFIYLILLLSFKIKIEIVQKYKKKLVIRLKSLLKAYCVIHIIQVMQILKKRARQ